MKQGLSIITTIRGDEPKAKSTVMNIQAHAGCPVEVIAVYDGTEHDPDLPVDQILEHKTARGIGPSRHKGIMSAKYSVVLLVDAHMHFQPGFGQIILDHYKKKAHAKDVTCGRCVPSMLDLSPMSDAFGNPEHGYTGARFSMKSEEPGGEKWCLSGKWAEQEVNSEIGCVFGATYAFRKKWYEELGEPLNLLRGWFGDEEYLSIASWLAGGRCVLLDYWASHWFRDKPSFTWSRSDMLFPAVNRTRLIDLFPAEHDLKQDLEAWNALSIRSFDADFISAYEADRTRPEVIAAKKLWSSWSENVNSFIDRWVDAEAKPLEVRQKMREKARPWKQTELYVSNRTPVEPVKPVPVVQKRSYIVCANCKERNTFRVDRTARVSGSLRRYGRCKNPHCRIRGVMINRPEGQVMYWGKEAKTF